MKIKTQDLIGAALDWAVAKCEGTEITFSEGLQAAPLGMPSGQWEMYSTNWAQGGPIIEREITKVFRNVGGTWSAMILKDIPIPFEERGTSLALTRRAQWNGAGPTFLIAAMRCYCCSKLGDVIDIPEELCQ